MKIFRVLGAEGEVVFQERVPDDTPEIKMEWPKPISAKIIQLQVYEVKEEVK